MDQSFLIFAENQLSFLFQVNRPARPDYSDARACLVHKSLKICEQGRLAVSRDNPDTFSDILLTAQGAMAKSVEVSPMKSVAEELDFLRKSFRESLNVYAKRIETQLTQIREQILEQTKNPKPSGTQIRDLRDILTLCRTLDLKPEKGRRKDLKKIEAAVEEIQLMIQNW
jgi:hypothetical protein